MINESIHNHETAKDLNSLELAEVLRAIGEEYGFDEQTCRELADMPFEEAF